MSDPTHRRESIYGTPAADQIIHNRHYVVGYSYYFRQAKWALEIVNAPEDEVKRKDHFRSDYRIPEIFRADDADYTNSGYSRGHLVPSANHRESELENSETFLLSNMSPQTQKMNGGRWKQLETAVRKLDADPKVLETFVISGPIFLFDKTVKIIGTEDGNGVSIPVPNAYFKSILVERNTGTLKMWSFIMPNGSPRGLLKSYLVPTRKVEQYAGIELWSKLKGTSIERKKKQTGKMW